MVTARARSRDDRQLTLFAFFRLCAVEGCGKRHYLRGFCVRHYSAWRRYGDPTEQRLAGPGEPEAFLKNLVGYRADDCIPWPYSKNSEGRGLVSIKGKGKSLYASREVCRLAHGDPPGPGYHAAHSCGRSICVNPNHLRWATPKENAADKVRHGTNGQKITDSDRLLIQARILRGETAVSIARDFDVSDTLIRLIGKESANARAL